ncbi:MAG: dihydrodipicolinate synthase family protein [Pirellulales bacterium]
MTTPPSSTNGHAAHRPLAGVLPIVHMPFDAHDRIDEADLEREVDWVFTVGADGLGTGMVSEVLRLTAEERTRVAALLVGQAAGRGSVFMSVGAESGTSARANAVAAVEAGCAAVMAVPPLTTRLPAPALVDYFHGIAAAVPVPLIVQDASGYVGQSIPFAVYAELLDRHGPDKILFKPEAAPLGPNLSRLRDATEGRAKIYEGSGGILLVDAHRRGIVGTMPGIDLLDGVVALWRALEAGEDDEIIYRLSLPICGIVAIQMQAGLDGFLAVEKYLLVKRGLFKSARRREPHAWSLDDETAREVDRLFDRLTEAVAATYAARS